MPAARLSLSGADIARDDIALANMAFARRMIEGYTGNLYSLSV